MIENDLDSRAAVPTDKAQYAVIQQMALSLGGNVRYLEGSQPAATPPGPAAWEYWTRSVSN